MSYCSISDIQTVIASEDLAQLTNDSGGNTIDNTKITDSINYVDNIIDGYLRGRYNLPLSSTPEELRYLATDFTVYRLYSRRMYTDIPDVVKQKYIDVIKTLEKIQMGTFNLGIESSEAFNEPTIKTNKDSLSSSVNKYYDKNKWDEYES